MPTPRPSPLADEMATVLAGSASGAFCISCLAARVNAQELTVREVAAHFIILSRWRLETRRCGGCGRSEECLVPGASRSAGPGIVRCARCGAMVARIEDLVLFGPKAYHVWCHRERMTSGDAGAA